MVLIGALLAVPAKLRAEDDFEPGNHGWNGGSTLIQILGAEHPRMKVPRHLDIDAIASADSVLLLNPTQPLPTAGLKRFLDRGGRVALATDLPAASQFLESFSIRQEAPVALAARYFEGNRQLPVAERLEDHPLTEGVPWLLTNHPSVLFHDELPAILGFEQGAVVLSGAVGKGRLVAIADTSIFINNMMALPTHQTFATNLAQSMGGANGTLWIATPTTTIVASDTEKADKSGSVAPRFRRVHELLDRLAHGPVPAPVQQAAAVTLLLLLAGMIAVWLPHSSPYGAQEMLPTHRGYGGLWGLYRDALSHRDATSAATLMYKNEFEHELLSQLHLAFPARLKDVMTALQREGFSQHDLDDARSLLLDLDAFSSREDGERLRRATPRLLIRTVERGERLLSILTSDRTHE